MATLFAKRLMKVKLMDMYHRKTALKYAKNCANWFGNFKDVGILCIGSVFFTPIIYLSSCSFLYTIIFLNLYSICIEGYIHNSTKVVSVVERELDISGTAALVALLYL